MLGERFAAAPGTRREVEVTRSPLIWQKGGRRDYRGRLARTRRNSSHTRCFKTSTRRATAAGVS